MTAKTQQDDQKIKRFIKHVESDLLNLGKVMNTKAYNLSSIKRKAKKAGTEDLVVKKMEEIEESIKSLSAVFCIETNPRDLKPFFTVLRRTLNPPRQTLITDWLKEFSKSDEKRR
ncbi:MAG: hypothetical protein GYA24_08390 [Candidatus Lokiarchaeota archaeon]|nr:hypothetical protein [Candidatus Lokiarchaeota archaeon]